MKILCLNTFLVLFLFSSCREIVRPKEVVQNGDLVCSGVVKANRIIISLNKDFYASDAEMNTVSSSEVVSARINTNSLTTSILAANNKVNTLYINSFLVVKGQIRYENKDSKDHDPKATSFIQLSHESLYLNNVKQWKLIREADLEDVNKSINVFLVSINSVKDFEINKFLNLTTKPFEHLLIEANFKFVDHLWNGNTAYIKVNEDIYWLDHHLWELEQKTQSSQDCHENVWNNNIRIIVPIRMSGLKAGQIKLTFGIKLHEKFDTEEIIHRCPDLIKLISSSSVISFDNFLVSIK